MGLMLLLALHNANANVHDIKMLTEILRLLGFIAREAQEGTLTGWRKLFKLTELNYQKMGKR